jgi:hypothetical protein
MTELTIAICADDDRAALRVLGRIVDMMPAVNPVTSSMLNKAGYTVGDADGSGTATVRRTRDGVGPVTGNGAWCLWTVDDDGVWNTSCKQAHVFETGTPGQNEYAFCPYCGKPMAEYHTPNDKAQFRSEAT